jgi:hypothetical protein
MVITTGVQDHLQFLIPKGFTPSTDRKTRKLRGSDPNSGNSMSTLARVPHQAIFGLVEVMPTK